MWDWFNICIRTNNHVEGWHRGLKNYFDIAHLQFYRFVNVLHSKEEKSAERLRDRINRPNDPPKTDPVYVELNARILSLHQEFYIRIPLDFILPLAHTAPKPLRIAEK